VKPTLAFADVAAKIRRPRRITELVLDAGAAAEVEQLADLLERLRARDELTDGPPQAPAVAKELQQAEERADGSRVAFTLEAISHTAYRELIATFPAGKEQLERQAAEGGEQWPFDPDTFAPALVQAQLIEPAPGSDEDFQAFWDGLSDGQLRQLWLTALGVQMQVTTVGPRSVAAAEVLRAATA
jgi:hypothetical protein